MYALSVIAFNSPFDVPLAPLAVGEPQGMPPHTPDGGTWGGHGIPPIAPGPHPPVGRLWLVFDGVPVP